MPEVLAPVVASTGHPAALDPRTKVVVVVLVSAAVMGPGGLRFVPAALLLAVGLALTEGAGGRAAALLAGAAGLWVLGWLLPPVWPNAFTAIVSLSCVYLLRFVVAIGVGMHLIATTSPTQLSAGLRAWHVPRPIAVTLAVMLRFFPVVAAESKAVADAMRLRGLTGLTGLLRHPVLAIERFTVPMITASLRASEDLSSSAILRGLGSRRTPTSMNPPRLGPADLALALVVAVLLLASMVLPEPLT